MLMPKTAIWLAFASTFFTGAALAREWSDASGHYKVEADLIAFNDSTVVLKKANHDLLSVPVKDLSEADQEYLKSEEAAATAEKSGDARQTWTMRSGLKVIGKVMDYARRDLVIQRIRGRIYVNDRPYENLPAVYREMVPLIVSHFEMQKIDGKKGLEAWLLKQRGAARTFTWDGVLLELENGDLYGVPFFFFSEDDLKVLQPGWDRWLAVEKDRQAREMLRFMLQSQAEAYQQHREATRQMMQLQLQLQAYKAGLFDLWEVMLVPAGNGIPQVVVVPGRNSDQAAAAALQQFPSYTVGGIARVNRRR